MLPLIFLFIVFSSCGSGKKEVPPTHITEQLDGFWMADEYLKNIEESRSVYANRKYSETFLGFVLDHVHMEEGYIELHGMSDHKEEVFAKGTWDEARQRFACVTERPPQDSFYLWPTRTGLVKCLFPRQDKKEEYRRAKTPQDALRKALFDKKHYDILGNSEASLDKRGHAYHFEGEAVSRFEVDDDFSAGQQIDILSIYKMNDIAPSHFYNFKFTDDTLFLYEMSSLEPTWEVGPLKYKLLPRSMLPRRLKQKAALSPEDSALVPITWFPPDRDSAIDTTVYLGNLDEFIFGLRKMGGDKLHREPVIDNHIRFSNDSISLEIHTAAFNKNQHTLRLAGGGKYVEAIDGKPAWGGDGTMPRMEIESISLSLNGKSIPLSDSLWFNLYEPNLNSSMAVASPDGGFSLSMFNSDGAGAYTFILIFNADGSLKNRIVGFPF